MRFDDQCIAYFSRVSRQRGEQYFYEGRVAIERDEPERIAASVRGTSIYGVEIELVPDGSPDEVSLETACTCPHFLLGEPCKHIWATILAARHHSRKFGHRKVLVLSVVPKEVPEALDLVALGGPGGGEGNGHRQLALITVQRPLPPDSPAAAHKKPSADTSWRHWLNGVAARRPLRDASRPPSAQRQIWYGLGPPDGRTDKDHLRIAFWQRKQLKTGAWGKFKAFRYHPERLDAPLDPEDTRLLALMAGHCFNPDPYSSNPSGSQYFYYRSIPDAVASVTISPAWWPVLLPALCATGRLVPAPPTGTPLSGLERPFIWDDGAPWRFRLQVSPEAKGKALHVDGVFARDGEEQPLSAPQVILGAGLLIFPGRMARLEPPRDFAWITALRARPAPPIPVRHQAELLRVIADSPELPDLRLAPELDWQIERGAPTPRLLVTFRDSEVEGAVDFDYGGQVLAPDPAARLVHDTAANRLLLRDPEREQAALARLAALGARGDPADPSHFKLSPAKFPALVNLLLDEGWHVQADGRRVTRHTGVSATVASGVDWFDLRAEVAFDQQAVTLPRLLASREQHKPYIVLDDGTAGLLPEDWLRRYAPLSDFATQTDGALRFTRAQAALLDAWLEELPDVQVDRDFADFRRRLARFDGIRELAAPAGFSGTLRGYQREGLGWLNFLKDFKLGGCLADDMGLGKTVQILALLEQQRDPGAAHAPSLVVLPRTLVTNWLREAERFAPALRVLDFSGAERAPLRERFAQADLVLTTYGVLRRDIAWLRSVPFRWVILDEAQAVKNGNAQTAKAARLLQAEHRLAATGTPVENHLGELGALFDFLNPGLLGRSAVASLARLGAREAPEEPLRLLARALRPFILRRTKAQVLPELPEKTEQVLFCDLGTEQRSLYDELRIHYRAAVDGRIRDVGVGRSKILVLEALLRLRQAACHPGLVDKARAGEAGGKLEVLLHRLEELQAEGNKALVFSQFTSLLAILRPELERRGLTYEYLDGRTRDRQARVDRFQNDPECKLFLISLKAGGQGLNLTAAQYVFLLDPWWNPAVEAQAVDRAHRIGQANKVFAYRLVARDTVEEKILELQSSKRRLADAVISAEAGGLKSLNADDVRLLFA